LCVSGGHCGLDLLGDIVTEADPDLVIDDRHGDAGRLEVQRLGVLREELLVGGVVPHLVLADLEIRVAFGESDEKLALRRAMGAALAVKQDQQVRAGGGVATGCCTRGK
jgi:hypothetical protein